MMHRSRIVTTLLCITAIIGVFIAKMFLIQMYEFVRYEDQAAYTRKSVNQRMRGIVLNDGRGQFYDRNQVPLTGESFYTVALFPNTYKQFQGNSQNVSSKISNVLNIPVHEWDQWVSSLQKPDMFTRLPDGEAVAVSEQQAESINELNVPGLAAVPIVERYPEPYLASHALGFVSQHPEKVQELYAEQLAKGRLSLNSRIGAAGLEKTLDEWLRGQGIEALVEYVDALDRPMRGLSIRKIEPDNPFYPLKIVTTLDKSIQQQVEQTVDQAQMSRGAVVVLDAKTADIVAMVSRPQYDPNDIDPEAGNWKNRAVKAAIPGSIFKTVTAAAALEYKVTDTDESFHCSGHLGKYKFVCWKAGGHGSLTLSEAYAQSCNITFARLAERLTGEQMEITARKLGLLKPVGETTDVLSVSNDKQMRPVLDGEEAGALFAEPGDGNDEGARIQSAIGQRDVMVSPLQAANMVVTLLNDGEVKRPRILKEIRHQTGSPLKWFRTQTMIKKGEGISAQTAAQLRTFMRDVVTQGTGKSLNHLRWNVAGKSGTAQIGNTGMENQWFIGYGPVERPRYAVAVLVEQTNGARGHEATRLFGELMDVLATSETAAHPLS